MFVVQVDIVVEAVVVNKQHVVMESKYYLLLYKHIPLYTIYKHTHMQTVIYVLCYLNKALSLHYPNQVRIHQSYVYTT